MNNFRNIVLHFLFLVSPFVVAAQQITWNEVVPGVWKGVVGKPEAYDLIKASGSSPNKEALTKLGTSAFPMSQSDIAGVIS